MITKTLFLKPRLSEKAYSLSEQGNTYVFDVPITANKCTVGDAVAVQFGVSVVSVKIASTAGKPIRTYKKRGRNMTSRRAGVRKAYVTLARGDKLSIFADADNKSDKESK